MNISRILVLQNAFSLSSFSLTALLAALDTANYITGVKPWLNSEMYTETGAIKNSTFGQRKSQLSDVGQPRDMREVNHSNFH